MGESVYVFCLSLGVNMSLMSDWSDVQFHYECVGILKAPPSNVKWYCPDCAVTQPPKKKRKR